jgi:hypothetical protein
VTAPAARGYPAELVDDVAGAMSPHLRGCTRGDGCEYCARWRTRARRALDHLAGLGRLASGTGSERQVRAAERRRITRWLRGPAAAAVAIDAAASAGGTQDTAEVVRLHLAQQIDRGVRG